MESYKSGNSHASLEHRLPSISDIVFNTIYLYWKKIVPPHGWLKKTIESYKSVNSHASLKHRLQGIFDTVYTIFTGKQVVSHTVGDKESYKGVN